MTKHLRMKSEQLCELVIVTLDEIRTTVLIVASGTSNRHVKALVDNGSEKAKAAGHAPIGVEGENGGEWVLLDLEDALVHVMLPKVREFYNLEKLWSLGAAADATATERN